MEPLGNGPGQVDVGRDRPPEAGRLCAGWRRFVFYPANTIPRKPTQTAEGATENRHHGRGRTFAGVHSDPETGTKTYLLIDGENIDATLGVSVLGRRPNPDERPRWERVRDYARDLWDQPVRGLFFLNASGGTLPSTFIAALLAMDYRPIPLAGRVGEKVVDIAIKRTLDALVERPGDVLLASHDGDFLPQMRELLGPGRQVGLLGFREYLNSGFVELEAAGLRIFDLEEDVRSFNAPLPRVRIIPIEAFDPLPYL